MTPDEVLDEATATAGFTSLGLLAETEKLLADPKRVPKSAMLGIGRRPNPFNRTKAATLSEASLKELSALREKISTATCPPPPSTLSETEWKEYGDNPSLPVDICQIAEAYGITTMPSAHFGREFYCLIEYNKRADRFVLYYRVTREGRLPTDGQIAIARHLGHFLGHKSDLSSGTIADTTHLEVDADEVDNATIVARELLLPERSFNKDLESLAQKYAIPTEIVGFHAGAHLGAAAERRLAPRSTVYTTPVSVSENSSTSRIHDSARLKGERALTSLANSQ